MMENGYDMGIMNGMWFFPLLFLAAILIAAFFIVRGLLRSRQDRTIPAESALEVLKKRYAGGEINLESFEQMKREIGD